MSLLRAWMLLLVVGTLGCGDKPEPVATIEKLGGKVGYDEGSPERPIVQVNFQLAEVTDAHLVHLKALTSLQHLDLSITQVTDAGLEHLKGMTSLRVLYLERTWVGDAGLEYLKGLTSLRVLNLGRTPFTDAGVNELKKALPKCRILH